MPNTQRLDELEADVAKLKTYAEQSRELLNAIDLRLVEVRDELKRSRRSAMHEVTREGS